MTLLLWIGAPCCGCQVCKPIWHIRTLLLQACNMPLERRDLQLVRAIGEAGTLLGGARKLGIDHSTAFRRLNALEAQLGVRLFIRARDGYAPTAAGEAMIDVAAQVDADIVALERRLAGAD